MKFIINYVDNIEKYMDKLVKYTGNINTVVDMVLDKLKHDNVVCHEVDIEINGLDRRACVLNIICDALGIECKIIDGTFEIKIKDKDVKRLSETLFGVFYGFKIIEQFRAYGIGYDLEMVISICGKTIILDVEFD